MVTLWDSRYNTEDFVYGKEPNNFFAALLGEMSPGSLLLPGEGEGRNAIHAALQGWSVDAFDQSPVAAKKALAYAVEKNVVLDYHVKGLEEFSFRPDFYDVIALIYFHVPPPARVLLHQQVVRALKPGGTVLLEAFHGSQLGNSTGGPNIPELLFTEEVLLSDFSGLKQISLDQVNIRLEEGTFHQGEAEVIRYVGRKTQ